MQTIEALLERAGVSPSRLHSLHRAMERLFEDNHYRLLFVTYTLVVSLVSSCLMYGIQRSQDTSETFFATWFTAISCFSCTGLSIARISDWRLGAQVVMILTIECGSLVLCSSMPSALRIYRLRQIECRQASDRRLVRRHLNVNISIVWCSIAYWALIRMFAFILLVGHRGVWWTIFHVSSGLNNAGFTLSPLSFATRDLAGDNYTIIVFCICMPMGNTLFPVWQQLIMRMWRALLFKLSNCMPTEVYTKRRCFFGLSAKELGDAINELLCRPSAYYTHLFLPKQTVVLLLMWCALTTVDYLMFIPEYNTSAFVTEGSQWLQALFQTITVRTTGFTIMNIQQVDLGHLTYWVMAMYLSSYPFLITEGTARVLLDDIDDEYEFPEAMEPPVGGVVVATSSTRAAPKEQRMDMRAVLRAEESFESDGDVDGGSLRNADEVPSKGDDDVDSSIYAPTASRSTSLRSLRDDGCSNERLTQRRTRSRLTKRSLDQLARGPPRMPVRCRNEPLEGNEPMDGSDHPNSRSVTPNHASAAGPDHNITRHQDELQTDAGSSTVFVSRGVRNALQNIKSQAGSTVAQEIGWLYLCCIIICYIEGYNLNTTTNDVSPLARTLFEVSSAYGTVGLTISSQDAPDLSYTFVLHTASQIIILLLMYFGKFRGLPQTIELDAVQHLLNRRDSYLAPRGVHFDNHATVIGDSTNEVVDDITQDGALQATACAERSPDTLASAVELIERE